MTNILVVDDSTSIRQLASFTLKKSDFDVDEAADGQKALQMAKSTNYDLVLTDCNMPVMDGIELTQGLRSMANYKATPILMLTTESESDKKMKGKEAGVTGWIVKPFNPESLIKTIKKVLN